MGFMCKLLYLANRNVETESLAMPIAHGSQNKDHPDRTRPVIPYFYLHCRPRPIAIGTAKPLNLQMAQDSIRSGLLTRYLAGLTVQWLTGGVQLIGRVNTLINS